MTYRRELNGGENHSLGGPSAMDKKLIPNLYFFLICCVLGLTLIFALGAGAMILFGPSPLTPSAERLFEEFLFFAGAGFFTILGLLGAQSHAPDR
jgi:hypothetical protein